MIQASVGLDYRKGIWMLLSPNQEVSSVKAGVLLPVTPVPRWNTTPNEHNWRDSWTKAPLSGCMSSLACHLHVELTLLWHFRLWSVWIWTSNEVLISDFGCQLKISEKSVGYLLCVSWYLPNIGMPLALCICAICKYSVPLSLPSCMWARKLRFEHSFLTYPLFSTCIYPFPQGISCRGAWKTDLFFSSSW